MDPRAAHRYRRRARLSRSLGLAAIPVAGAALINPELLGDTSITVLDGPVSLAWTIGYLLGGIFAAAGVLWRPYPRPELELLGVWLLAGAMFTNAVVIVAVRGAVGGGLTALGLFAIADVLRARTQDLEEARIAERRRQEQPFPGPDQRGG